MLNITERQTGNASVLDLKGNIILGGGSKKLGQEIRRLMEEGKTNILLNFGGVKYIDSSGVGELLALAETFSKTEGNLKLCNLPQKVEEVLTLSSILPLFEVYDNETEALKKYSSAA